MNQFRTKHFWKFSNIAVTKFQFVKNFKGQKKRIIMTAVIFTWQWGLKIIGKKLGDRFSRRFGNTWFHRRLHNPRNVSDLRLVPDLLVGGLLLVHQIKKNYLVNLIDVVLSLIANVDRGGGLVNRYWGGLVTDLLVGEGFSVSLQPALMMRWLYNLERCAIFS